MVGEEALNCVIVVFSVNIEKEKLECRGNKNMNLILNNKLNVCDFTGQ